MLYFNGVSILSLTYFPYHYFHARHVTNVGLTCWRRSVHLDCRRTRVSWSFDLHKRCNLDNTMQSPKAYVKKSYNRFSTVDGPTKITGARQVFGAIPSNNSDMCSVIGSKITTTNSRRTWKEFITIIASLASQGTSFTSIQIQTYTNSQQYLLTNQQARRRGSLRVKKKIKSQSWINLTIRRTGQTRKCYLCNYRYLCGNWDVERFHWTATIRKNQLASMTSQ